MEQKLEISLSLAINKDLLGQLNMPDDKFIIPEPDVSEEPKMQVLVKPIPNNSESIELF